MKKIQKKHLLISFNKTSGKLDILHTKIKEFLQVFSYLHIKVAALKYIHNFLIHTACLKRANQLFLKLVKNQEHSYNIEVNENYHTTL